MIKSITDIVDQKSLLTKWRGAKVEVWIFSLTFRRLALQLSFPERSDVLYVVGAGCRHISGPFSWERSNVAISHLEPERSVSADKTLMRVYDQDAPFELICSGGVILVQSSEVVTSFDEFHFPEN